MKKTLLATALSLAIPFASSVAGGPDEAPQKPNAFSGLSIMGGPTAVIFDQDSANFQPRDFDIGGDYGPTTPLDAGTTWSGGVRLGLEYGKNFDGLYLGLNLSYASGIYWARRFNPVMTVFNGAASTTSEANARMALSLKYMLHGLIKLGYVFDISHMSGESSGRALMIYAQGGATGARSEAQDISDFNQTTNTNTNFLGGWAAGGGIEAMLTPQLSIGADYLYSQYQRLNQIAAWMLHDVASGITALGWYSSNPRTQLVTLYMRYNFSS